VTVLLVETIYRRETKFDLPKLKPIKPQDVCFHIRVIPLWTNLTKKISSHSGGQYLFWQNKTSLQS